MANKLLKRQMRTKRLGSARGLPMMQSPTVWHTLSTASRIVVGLRMKVPGERADLDNAILVSLPARRPDRLASNSQHAEVIRLIVTFDLIWCSLKFADPRSYL